MITNIWKSKYKVVFLGFILVGILTIVVKILSHRGMYVLYHCA